MELLQRHLPGLHRVLRGALDYVSSFSTYLLGEQAHPGAEDHGTSGETDSSDPPKGVSAGGYGEGDPEHYGEEAPGGQHEAAGHPALQVPPDTQDPTPQGGRTVLRGSGARMGSVSDQDTPHPLWAWPGAVSLEPGCGELTAPGGRAPPPSPSLSREPGPPALPPARGGRSLQTQREQEEERPEGRPREGEPGGHRTRVGAHGEEEGDPEGGVSPPGAPTEQVGGGGSSIWLGTQREGEAVAEGSWPQGGAPGHPPLCLVPQLELPDGAQPPLPEPGVVAPLDVSAQRSRVLLRRKGSVRRAPSLRAQRPPGGAPPETLPQPPPRGPPGGFLPPQPQAPRRQLPGHAGFGLAHPNMMAELKFRLRRPPPQ
ncbi:apolipoprotein B receptor-like [Mauremys mutica]|uniref:apolipoprotein B receptor-like n=1 Tax=Mauremys mutica TaxID=74926 RepID=UPI001D16D2FC|nr:apolipoprotein B receptor-like [Mauremys mutica]